MTFDLHTHSAASDGRLSPLALYQRATDNQVAQLALTDHDTVAGVVELQRQLAEQPAVDTAPVLVPGVEVTALADKLCVHVVGLWIDPRGAGLNTFLDQQFQVREQRGIQIAAALEKAGIPGALEGARRIANGAVLARPHFARFLVEQEACRNEQRAFDKYLGRGKPAEVRCEWPSMAAAVQAIQSAGGRAVLAHPEKYRLTRTKLRELLDSFRDAGGDSVEVVSGAQDKQSSAMLARLAEQRDLSCSTGSDFHSPDQVWCDLGRQPQLPVGCRAVWE